MSFNVWAEEIHATAVEKGWWEKDRNFGEVLMLVTSELAEAFEEYRAGHGFTEVYYKHIHPTTGMVINHNQASYDWSFTYGIGEEQVTQGKPEGIPVELADAIIRLFDWMGWAGIDIEAIVAEKQEFNTKRQLRHGGKLA